jgi:O-antigen ligase
VFILFNRLLIPYKNKLVHFVMMFFLAAMSYRALITFSRGGVVVALVMIIVFSVILYFSTNLRMKLKLSYKLIAVIGAVCAIWFYAFLQTGGLIENRYANEDALGREKEDITTGRSELLSTDFEAFSENPLTGIGVGNVKGLYIDRLNLYLPSHNELSRLISEHGLLGIFALLILFITPIVSKLYGRKNIYFYPLLLFSLLTISHSSMRIAAPAFIYGLSLLQLRYSNEKKKPAISRE